MSKLQRRVPQSVSFLHIPYEKPLNGFRIKFGIGYLQRYLRTWYSE